MSLMPSMWIEVKGGGEIRVPIELDLWEHSQKATLLAGHFRAGYASTPLCKGTLTLRGDISVL